MQSTCRQTTPTCSQQMTHKYLPKLHASITCYFHCVVGRKKKKEILKSTLKQKQTTAWRANGTLNEGNEKGGGEEGGRRKNGRKKPCKFKHAFLESAALCYYFAFFSLAQRQFQKERLILIIRRPFPFCFILFSISVVEEE